MAYSDDYGGYSFCSATLMREKWAVTLRTVGNASGHYYGQGIYFVMGDNLYTDGQCLTTIRRSTDSASGLRQ